MLPDPDLERRCDIMFPEGELTTFGFDVIGSEDPRSRLEENRGELVSVGVGGVLTIVGATSPGGGVEGGALVSTVLSFAVRGRSGDEVDGVEMGCEAGRSGNNDPSLDVTLPRRPSLADEELFSRRLVTEAPPPNFRSGLVFGLGPLRTVNASFSLPTGEGERF